MEFARSRLQKTLGEKGTNDLIECILSLEKPKEIRQKVNLFLPPGKETTKIIEILIDANKRCKERRLNPGYKKGEEVSPPTTSRETVKTDPNGPRKKPVFHHLFNDGARTDVLTSILPGRHPCQCLATNHKLVNNCIKCGRIVCVQEGSGPCYFCGNLVCTSAEWSTINSGAKSGERLRNKLSQAPWAPGTETPPYKQKAKPINEQSSSELEGVTQAERNLTIALSHRNKLLHSDKNAKQRNRVIDDELDYFASENGYNWLTPEVRDRVARKIEELKQKRHASRLGATDVTFDFANLTVSETDNRLNAVDELYAVKESDFAEEEECGGDEEAGNDSSVFVDFATALESLSFTANSDDKLKCAHPSSAATQRMGQRIQDDELNAIRDTGMCLSMHQPWASLLVLGIKKHEGRSWYSAHRGRLWIAATAKKPEPEEVEEVEKFYLDRGVDRSLFPQNYPTGCLLGCVSVSDVLDQENYVTKYPDGESACPFVFICDMPRELLIKQPMKGNKKIYKLEKTVHRAAAQCLV